MKNCLKRLLAAGAIVLSTLSGAAAAPICASAASDPDGDGWGWENNQSCKVAAASTTTRGFKVSGTVVRDANGNPFIARGVNNPHAWFDTQAFNVLPNLAARKTNLIRVVWTMNGTAARLDQVLSAIIGQKMVAMVELHDGTGSNSSAVLQSMANYWVRSDVLAVLKKHERALMVNIANEWGDHYLTPLQWRDAYRQPISTLRQAGLTTTLVIDNPGWGGNPNGALLHGRDLLDHDPQRNLLFAVHAYGSMNNPNDIYNMMYNYRANNLALVIGEFGYNYNNGNNNLGSTVNAPLLMQYAQQFGVGTIAWSTAGNDGPNAWLDLMTPDWTGTTSWGNTVWYGQYGIANTAQRASIF